MVIEGVETGWYDGVGIWFAIIAVVLTTAMNDYQQDQQASRVRGVPQGGWGCQAGFKDTRVRGASDALCMMRSGSDTVQAS